MGEPNLFSITEWREERAAILQFDAGLPREEAERQADTMSEEWRHACEVRSVAKMYREQGGEAVKAYLADCRKHRPAAEVDRLREEAIREVKRNANVTGLAPGKDEQ